MSINSVNYYQCWYNIGIDIDIVIGIHIPSPPSSPGLAPKSIFLGSNQWTIAKTLPSSMLIIVACCIKLKALLRSERYTYCSSPSSPHMLGYFIMKGYEIGLEWIASFQSHMGPKPSEMAASWRTHSLLLFKRLPHNWTVSGNKQVWFSHTVSVGQ